MADIVVLSLNCNSKIKNLDGKNWKRIIGPLMTIVYTVSVRNKWCCVLHISNAFTLVRHSSLSKSGNNTEALVIVLHYMSSAQLTIIYMYTHI